MTTADFWKLTVESRLLSPQECQRLSAEYARVGGAGAENDAALLAKWLMSGDTLSRYQAKLLLAGRPGPFVYGDYVICDRVEGGRLGGLFRARHAPTKHPVCLFFLAGPALQNPRALAGIAPAVSAAAAASHGQSNITRCYQWTDLGAFKFIVLEDLRGQSLADRLTAGKQLSPREACRMARAVARGLARLHAQGQVHADIRPANVWLSENGPVQLIGFPLARDPLAPSASPGDAGLDYDAPELAQTGAKPDARSDIYALGCLLYQSLTGQVPFPGGDARQKAARKLSETPKPVDRVNPAAPAALAHVVGYLMHKNPEQRYQQAAGVIEALAVYSGADGPQDGAGAIVPSRQAFEDWLKQPSAGPTAGPTAGLAAVAAPVAARPMAPRPAIAQAVRAPIAVQPSAMPAVAPRAVSVAAAPAAIPTAVPTPLIRTAPSFDAAGAGRSSVAARVAGSQKTSLMTYVGFGGAGLLVVAALVFLITSADTNQGKPAADGPAPSPSQGATTVASTGTGGSNKALDGTTHARVDKPGMEPINGVDQPIWQSPTSGKPLDLAYLAAGAQVVLAVRPAALVKHAEWEKLKDPRTLGQLSGWLTAELPKYAGTPLENIDQVIIGLLDASPAPPRWAMVVHTVDELAADDVAQAWGDVKTEEVEKTTVYALGERAFYLPAKGKGKLLAIAPPDELRDVVKVGDEPPALRREMEVLLASSDAERHLTLVVAPNFPFTGGKALFTDQGAKLQSPLDGFLEVLDGESKLELPKAAMLSLHLTDNLFAELRIYNSFVNKPTGVVAFEYRQRIGRLPKQVSGYVRDLYLSDYSKPVLWDFKDQLEALDTYTRAGYEGKQVVLRAYLPAIAAHNLALGAHLALLENPGKAGPAALAGQPAKPATVADKLKQKTSLAFPKNTLEMALKLLGDDVGVEILMVGKDFQEEGITKNQSFKLDERDKPALEILLAIMKQADPVGRLVYVIKPKEGGGDEVLYVMTRAGVAKRGEKLPPELEKK
ncbi:MAG TPA: serine/threonine-protein kinase [Pirellulales bacterium]|nr:serine/threonine-protein kinase [Pirellulales bacterium]